MTKEQMDAFVAELSALSEKHGITIGGCGCCNSPFLSDIEAAEKGGGYRISDEHRVSQLEWEGPGK